MEFLIGGTAAVGAGFFTNPLEVLKTRMQLQGELKAKGHHAVYYKNVFHAGYVVAKNDGILALQKGLAPALLVQLVMNGLRLGTFQFADARGYMKDAKGNKVFYKQVLIGGIGGVLGQFLSSPLFLIKTHLQSRAVAAIAVGHQHEHSGLYRAIVNIYSEHGFLIGGTAAVGAGFFSNPLEVLKTRMQLQGELRAKGHHAVFYKNVFHAGYVVVKNDGILALQKGLTPALIVQFILNGLRLGTFQIADSQGFLNDDQGARKYSRVALVGGFGAALGNFLASPLFLIKTHLQSRSVATIAVGHQYKYSGLYRAFANIYGEYGIKGLFRGASASIPRAFVGSTSQLLSFDYAKGYLNKYEYFHSKPLLTSFLGSMVGGVAISVMMTPFDLVMTRLYNQPVHENGKGKLYTSYMDCVLKIYKAEGVSAFYKGVGPMYLRLGPHTVLCLVFWDSLKDLYDKYFIELNAA